MRDIAGRGRTVLFVSHNLGAVRNLCSRALLIESGRVAFDGPGDQAIARYERSFASGGFATDTVFEGPLASDIRFDRLTCLQNGVPVNMIDPLQPFELRVGGEAEREFPALEMKIAFFRDGVHIDSCFDTPAEAALQRGRFESVFRFPERVFRPGRYSLGIGASANVGAWLWAADAAVLDFSENLGGQPAERHAGVIAIPYESSRTP
jgi:lipopolysaccharide transport system ATP-binding protein